MIEIRGDLFIPPFDVGAVCIPTNLSLKSSGAAIMGAGLARKLVWLFPEAGIPEMLGAHIRHDPENLNGVWPMWEDFTGFKYLSFPTKYSWREMSDIKLISNSAHQLRELTEGHGFSRCKVWLPRVGCGMGKRDWETEVKPILEDILDDRFEVVTR
jgi:hypothetical protein